VPTTLEPLHVFAGSFDDPLVVLDGQTNKRDPVFHIFYKEQLPMYDHSVP
jgi:hypothetical protein